LIFVLKQSFFDLYFAFSPSLMLRGGVGGGVDWVKLTLHHLTQSYLELFWRTPHVIHYPSTAAKNESNDSGGSGIWHSGGISRAIRRICVISAVLSEPPAGTKCRFSANLPCSRQPFQRE